MRGEEGSLPLVVFKGVILPSCGKESETKLRVEGWGIKFGWIKFHQPHPYTFLWSLDMMEAMKSIVVMSKVLEMEERNMLSVAYKNVIGARRAAWRIFAGLESKHDDDAKRKELVLEYKEKIEKEIKDISAGILELLDEYLIPHAEEDESKVFFHKM